MKRILDYDNELDYITNKLCDLNFKKKQKLDIVLYDKTKINIYDNKSLRIDIDILNLLFKNTYIELKNKIISLEKKINNLENKINKYDNDYSYSYIS